MSVQIDGSTGNIIAIKADYSGDVSIGGTLTYEDVTNIDAIGLITARSGVKFGASGTTISGNSTGIGIGEASPTRKLVVAGDTNTVAVVRGATNGTSSLFLGDSDDEDIGALTYNHPSNYLAITVNASERARIDSSGRFGIGTNSPERNLVVNSGASSGYIQLVNTNSGTASSNGFELKLDSAGAIVDLINRENGAMRFFTNNTQRMQIDSSGDYLFLGGTLRIKNAANDTQYGAIYGTSTEFHVNAGVNNLVFTTAGGEAARFDSSGNIGIGTAAPRGLLHLHSSSAPRIDLTNTATGGSSTDGTTISVDGSSGVLNIIQRESQSIQFYTGNTERMRILSHGSVRCGTNFSDSDYANNTTDYWHAFHHHTNNQAAFVIEHTGNNNPYGLIIDFSDSQPDDNTHYFMSCIDSSAIRLQIKSDGDIDNHDNSYSGFSDVKLKQDIVDAGSQWDDIKNLRVRKFRFKSDVAEYGDEAKTLIGVVAQETELVSPGLVKESPDLDKYNNDLGTTTKSVRYSVLYMKAVKALQEAQTRIETLETQKTAQQTQIDDLLARVTALES